MAAEIGNMVMGFLPYILTIVGLFLTINVGIGLMKGSLIGAAVGVETDVENTVPEPPAEWMGSHEEWTSRWERKVNDEAFNDAWRNRHEIRKAIIEEKESENEG